MDSLSMWLRSKFASAYELGDDRNRLLPMEGLRGLAVFLVFFVHFDALYRPYLATGTFLEGASRFMGYIGNAGVDLFFVLSGYLIYGVVLRKRTPYAKFMRRRVQRIYPTFLAVLLVYLALSALVHSENKIHGTPVAAGLYILENALLLPGIFHITPIITVAWSLSYEFFFYFTIPLLVWIARMRNWNRAARVSFFVALWLGYLLFAFNSQHSQVRMLMFIAGILLYEAMDGASVRARLSRFGETAVAAAFVLSLVFGFLYDTQPHWFSFLPGVSAGQTILPGVSGFQGPYKVIALSLSCPLLCFYAFRFDGWLKRAFSWTPMRHLGNMSYSYYLIHGLALHAVSVVALRIWAATAPRPLLYLALLPVGFAATWIVSTCLFLLVEKPFSLKRRAEAKVPAQQPAPAPYAMIPGK